MSESWPLYKDKILTPTNSKSLVDTKAMNEFCSYAISASARRKCYETILSMVAVVVMINNHDGEQYAKLCTRLPQGVIGTCFSFGAHRLMQIDTKLATEASALCALAESYGFEVECYGQMVSNASNVFHVGSDEQKTFCGKLPQNWKAKCLNNN